MRPGTGNGRAAALNSVAKGVGQWCWLVTATDMKQQSSLISLGLVFFFRRIPLSQAFDIKVTTAPTKRNTDELHVFYFFRALVR